MALVVLSGVISFLALYYIGYGGAISEEGSKQAIKQLLAIYLPLITMMAAFYFGEPAQPGNQEKETPLESFLFSFVVVALWMFCPPLFVIFGVTIESTLRTIDSFLIYGETIAASGVAYYFARSS